MTTNRAACVSTWEYLADLSCGDLGAGDLTAVVLEHLRVCSTCRASRRQLFLIAMALPLAFQVGCDPFDAKTSWRKLAFLVGVRRIIGAYTRIRGTLWTLLPRVPIRASLGTSAAPMLGAWAPVSKRLVAPIMS